MYRTVIVITLFLTLGLSATAQPLINIPLDSPLIIFKGCRYIQYESLYPPPPEAPEVPLKSHLSVKPLRFSHSALNGQVQFNPNYAKWPAGIQMHILTDSKQIIIELETPNLRRNSQGIFQAYKDQKHLKDYLVKATKQTRLTQIQIQSEDGKKHHYRLMLPSNLPIRITALKIDQGTTLSPLKLPTKSVYVAMGDSITHGSVALNGISEKSYPAILASELGYDLYNLAIAGSRVSPMLGTMLQDWDKIDLITLLIGYNDFSWAGIKVEDYRKSYQSLLTNIRKTHPNTPLFCLTLTHTRLIKSPKTGVTPQQYRQVVRDLVKKIQQQGDQNIFLVEGESITNAQSLHDPAHLNEKGNQQVAQQLKKIITKQLNSKNQ